MKGTRRSLVVSKKVQIDEFDEEESLFNFSSLLVMMLIVLCVVMVGYYGYKHFYSDANESDLKIIKADNLPIKIIPEDPGGIAVPNLDKTVYENLTDNPNKEVHFEEQGEKLLPQPEEPVNRQEVFAEIQPEPAPVQEVQVAEVVQVETPQVAEIQPVQEELVDINSIIDENVDLTKTVIVLEPEPELIKPVPVTEKIVKPTPEKKVKKLTGSIIQLATPRSEAEAEKEWKRVKHKYADYLKDKHYKIEKVDLAEKGIVFRLRVGKIKNDNDARVICKKLTESGQGCFVVKR